MVKTRLGDLSDWQTPDTTPEVERTILFRYQGDTHSGTFKGKTSNGHWTIDDFRHPAQCRCSPRGKWWLRENTVEKWMYKP